MIIQFYKLKWLNFTGKRSFSELLDDIAHASPDELDDIAHPTRPQKVSRFSAESVFWSQCKSVIDQLLYIYYNIIAAISSEQARESNPRLPDRSLELPGIDLEWPKLQNSQNHRL